MIFPPPIVPANCPAVTPPDRPANRYRSLDSLNPAGDIPFNHQSSSRALMHDAPANIALHNTIHCTYIGFRDQERLEQDRKTPKDEENGIYEAVISELAQISQHMQRA